MSRKNKVNPDHYKVAGRLSPDDLARERMKQSAPQTARAWDERPGQPTWMDGRSAGPGPGNDAEAAGPSATRRPTGVRRVAKSGAKPQAKKPATGTRKTTVSRRSAREAGAERGDAQEQEGICREEENGPQDARTALSALGAVGPVIEEPLPTRGSR